MKCLLFRWASVNVKEDYEQPGTVTIFFVAGPAFVYNKKPKGLHAGWFGRFNASTMAIRIKKKSKQKCKHSVLLTPALVPSDLNTDYQYWILTYNCVKLNHFGVISWLRIIFLLATQMITSSGHAHFHVTNSQKNLKARYLINFWAFFSLIKFLYLNSHFAMHRFCFIFKRSKFKISSKY